MANKQLSVPVEQDEMRIKDSEPSGTINVWGAAYIIEDEGLLQNDAPATSQTEQVIGPDDLMDKFFSPSSKLAEAAFLYNERLLLHEAWMSSGDEIEVDDEEDDEPIQMFSSGEKRSFSHREECLAIGERLYHYLRFLAKNPEESQETGNIEALSRAGSFLLGFSGYQESLLSEEEKREMSLLIEKMISEFIFWLSIPCQGSYISPWGEMHLVDGKLELSSHILADEATDEPFTRANYISEFPKQQSKGAGD